MVLDFSDESGVVGQDEVDGSTLSTISSSSSDSVDVALLFAWELVVDDESDLLDVDTSGEQVSGDQDSGGSSSEFLHDHFSLELVEVSVHGGDDEVLALHSLGNLLDLSLGVAINQSLLDIHVGVKVNEDVKLPLLSLDGDVVLSDTFEGQLFVFNQDLGGVFSHEVGGELQNIGRHGGGEKGNLDVTWEELEDVLNLLLESSGEHFVGFVEDEQFQVVSLEVVLLHHFVNSSWGSNNDVLSFFQLGDVFLHDGSSDAGVDLEVAVLSEGFDDDSNLDGQLSGWGDDQSLAVVSVWVDGLECSNRKSSCFTSS